MAAMAGQSVFEIIRRATLLAAALLVAEATPAGATWSVVAADGESGDVGVAFASCVPGEVLGSLDQPLVPVVLMPGVGAGMAQGQFNTAAPDRIAELVAAGADADDIVADLTSEDFDELASIRQYGVVRLPSSAAGYTGEATAADALDRQADLLSVQGNLLTTAAVVDDATLAFETVRSSGGSLPDALVEALSAGSVAGGDSRCGDQTALFAQLVVAAPGDTATEPSVVLTVTVDEGDGQNPVLILAEAYERGQVGVIDARAPSSGTGWFPIVVLVAAVGMVVGGGVALARGIGSIRARR